MEHKYSEQFGILNLWKEYKHEQIYNQTFFEHTRCN